MDKYLAYVKGRAVSCLPPSVRISLSKKKLKAVVAFSHLVPSNRLSPIARFRRDGWNELISANLPLNAESQVIDFGGYVGDWTAEIYRRYECRIHVFEPVPKFVSLLGGRFAGNPKVTIYDFGIADIDQERQFGMADDATGAFAGGELIQIKFKSAETLNHLITGQVDLIAINIEGGEYELLPALEKIGLLARTNLLFIQFHQIGEDSGKEREICRSILEKTHQCVWNYDFVWEAWSKRS